MASGYSKCIPMAETKVDLICQNCDCSLKDAVMEKCVLVLYSFYEVSL